MKLENLFRAMEAIETEKKALTKAYYKASAEEVEEIDKQIDIFEDTLAVLEKGLKSNIEWLKAYNAKYLPNEYFSEEELIEICEMNQ